MGFHRGVRHPLVARIFNLPPGLNDPRRRFSIHINCQHLVLDTDETPLFRNGASVRVRNLHPHEHHSIQEIRFPHRSIHSQPTLCPTDLGAAPALCQRIDRTHCIHGHVFGHGWWRFGCDVVALPLAFKGDRPHIFPGRPGQRFHGLTNLCGFYCYV